MILSLFSPAACYGIYGSTNLALYCGQPHLHFIASVVLSCFCYNVCNDITSFALVIVQNDRPTHNFTYIRGVDERRRRGESNCSDVSIHHFICFRCCFCGDGPISFFFFFSNFCSRQ